MKKQLASLAALALLCPVSALAAAPVAAPAAPVTVAIPAAPAAASVNSGRDQRVEWQQVYAWGLDADAIDFVHSLDGKTVFVLTADHKVNVYTGRGELQGVIPVPAGVKNIDIAPRGEALFLIDGAGKTFSALAISLVADIDVKGSPFLGKENVPVTLVIFTDFECPYCSKAAPLMEEVLEKNPETVKIVFKNMPLSFHQNAQPAALAALAANQQGKFWQMHDALFAAGKLSADKINSIAQEVGLDMERFNKDRVGQVAQQALDKDLRDAQEAGVNSTPTIYVNGRKLQNRTLDEIQKMIDEELAGKKK